MEAAKITENKANEIKGQPAGFALFNPVQDIDGNWAVSMDCAAYMDSEDYEVIPWCPLIEELS